MKTQNKTSLRQVVLLTLLTGAMMSLWISCSTISSFDQYAYTQTTSLKVDALNVMTLATDSFTHHQTEVALLETNLQKLYEYERIRQKNQITLQQWTLLLQPEGHLLGGFLNRWKKEQVLKPVFVTEMKKIVGESFDKIAELEIHKTKKTTK